MISLPMMNKMCTRWNLPQYIQSQADIYFVKRLADGEFVQAVFAKLDGLYISEHGIDFKVIFMNDAMATYVKNGELEKRGESCNTFYWCSFRSLTFKGTGEGQDETKSYVLVQVDDKVAERRKFELEETGRRAAKPEGASFNFKIKPSEESSQGTVMFMGLKGRTFLEASQPAEKDSEEGEEK